MSGQVITLALGIGNGLKAKNTTLSKPRGRGTRNRFGKVGPRSLVVGEGWFGRPIASCDRFSLVGGTGSKIGLVPCSRRHALYSIALTVQILTGALQSRQLFSEYYAVD